MRQIASIHFQCYQRYIPGSPISADPPLGAKSQQFARGPRISSYATGSSAYYVRMYFRHIAVKVNRLLAYNRSTALAGASNTDTKRLWGLLKRTGNWCANRRMVYNIIHGLIGVAFDDLFTFSSNRSTRGLVYKL